VPGEDVRDPEYANRLAVVAELGVVVIIALRASAHSTRA
jgi:hypothetical protein